MTRCEAVKVPLRFSKRTRLRDLGVSDRDQDRIAVFKNPQRFGLGACVLCGAPPQAAQLFTPTKSRGDKFIYIYGLCAACDEQADKLKRIEQQLLKTSPT
jgi:hypothetical protein